MVLYPGSPLIKDESTWVDYQSLASVLDRRLNVADVSAASNIARTPIGHAANLNSRLIGQEAELRRVI
jgi:hypothetical protein